MKSDLILHLDLDGVITDFDSEFKKISGGIGPDEYREKFGNAAKLKKDISFWTDMNWIEGGKEIVHFAFKHFNLVRILTSAGTGFKDKEEFEKVKKGKITWITSHIPNIDVKNIIVVPVANMKSRHSGPDRILVDDKDITIKQWDAKGGIGILHNHLNYKNTIQELEGYVELSQSKSTKLTEIIKSL